MIDRNEHMRQLVEMALSYGRTLQSAQTGYLHFHYAWHEPGPYLPIPVIDNFLFALALLRSRQIENVTEAKTILEGLLHFQNKDISSIANGNFPIYLHQYPICHDRFIGVQVASVIYWILKLYHQGLGELKKRLEAVLQSTLQHALHTNLEKPAPYAMAVRIAATAKACGKLLQDHALIEQGTQLLIHLNQHPDYTSWACPKDLGTMLASLLMVYPRLSESPWAVLWGYLENTWHRQTSTYIGPAVREWQQGYEPQVTLYDLLLGYFSQAFSDRALKPSHTHLEAVLIPLCDDAFHQPHHPFQQEGTLGKCVWKVFHTEQMAYSLIQGKPEAMTPADEKGFHPFRMIWGNRQRVHSFVCQDGNCILFDCHQQGQEIHMAFELGAPVEVEDREKSREVIFFIDTHPTSEFWVSDQKSSTFRLNEPLTLKDEHGEFELKFEGEGQFMGHRMLGNRAAQLSAKRFDAYDWQVFLRTIRRNPKCRIDVVLRQQFSLKNDLTD